MTKPTRLSSESISSFSTGKARKKGNPNVGYNHGRLEYDMASQFQLIEDRGINVLWEESYICPCLSQKTRSPQPDCPICHGKGIAYLPAVKTKIAIQSQDRSVSNTDLGIYDSGTATGTTFPNSTVTFRDRISLPEVPIQQSMLIMATQNRIKEGYRLPYDVNKITLARTSEDILEEGRDYTIDLDQNIFKPSQEFLGKNISINIDTILRYIVIDILKESRYQYTKKDTPLEKLDHLPRKLLLKREDAWIDPIPIPIEDSLSTDEVEREGAWEDPKREMNVGFFGGEI